MKVLLDGGAKPNMVDNTGQTSLHKAAYKGHKNVVQLLVRRGAKQNVKDKEGGTPLSIALDRGHVAVANILSSPRISISISL